VRPFDSSGKFSPTVKTEQIRALAVRGAGVTVLSGGLGLTVQVLSTIVLARMLSPRDFGVVALVSTFSLLLMNFGQNGFTEAILQRPEIDHYLISNLFWINLSIGTALAGIFVTCGPLLEHFFDDPSVPKVVAGMSLSIFFSSLAVEHSALLRRAMRFTTISANDLVSRVVSVTLAIILAWRGRGHWALVAGVVGQSFIQAVGGWILCRWIPARPRIIPGTGEMFRFAIRVYMRFSINYFSRNVDNLLVGWRFGAVSLGFYKKAYDLFALSAGQLSAPLTNVAVASLSRFKPGSDPYRRHLISGVATMAMIGMGLSGAVTLIGTDLIAFLLGPRWEITGTIFTYFGPGIGAMTLYYIHGWIHLSIGRPDRWLRWGVLEAVVTSLCFLVALPWGPKGIAVAWTGTLWLLVIPAFWYALKPVQIRVWPVLAVIWRFILAGMLASVGCIWLERALASAGWFPAASALLPRIFDTLLFFGVLYLVSVVVLHKQWSFLDRAAESQLDDFRKSAQASPGIGTSQEKEERPLVSILIPAYNAERWIADCLRSALDQTWEPKEIIVVDDGSTDNTLKIVKRFESDKLRVVSQRNEGAAAARNLAFSLSHGDYIQWLDADDLLAPDKIELQMAAARNHRDPRCIFTSSFGTFASRCYHAKFAPTPLWTDLSPLEWLLLKMSNNVYMQTGTWLVSRELTQAAGPWDERLLGDDDGEYFCRLLLGASSVRFIPEATAYYRLPHRNSLSYVGLSGQKREAQWISMKLHMEYLLALENSERTRAACVQYLQNGMVLFYPKRRDIFHLAEAIAGDLGGKLQVPVLSPKYSWIQKLFGWPAAERVMVFLPTLRWSATRMYDEFLFNLERNVLFPEPISSGRPLKPGGASAQSANGHVPFLEADLPMSVREETSPP
jgi:PST family polysaccharide transporter